MDKPKLKDKYGISTNESILSGLADAHARITILCRYVEETNTRLYAMQKIINDTKITVSWHDEKFDDLRRYCDQLAGK